MYPPVRNSRWLDRIELSPASRLEQWNTTIWLRQLTSPDPIHGRGVIDLHLVEQDGRLRPCIPKKLEKKIFDFSYEGQAHRGFTRTYEKIVSNYHVKKVTG